jgi:hypothetical protein
MQPVVKVFLKFQFSLHVPVYISYKTTKLKVLRMHKHIFSCLYGEINV